jgi:hypothetical protein
MKFCAGDDLPGGADMYFVAYCLHDFNDVKALKLLQNIRISMESSSILVISEFVRRLCHSLFWCCLFVSRCCCCSQCCV